MDKKVSAARVDYGDSGTFETDASPRPVSPTTAFLKKRDAWLRAVVNDVRMAHPTVRVALHLAMRMDGRKQSGAWPSTKTIAKSTGVSIRAVLYAIDELSGRDRAEGNWSGVRYLHVERKRNIGNTYWLNFHWE